MTFVVSLVWFYYWPFHHSSIYRQQDIGTNPTSNPQHGRPLGHSLSSLYHATCRFCVSLPGIDLGVNETCKILDHGRVTTFIESTYWLMFFIGKSCISTSTFLLPHLKCNKGLWHKRVPYSEKDFWIHVFVLASSQHLPYRRDKKDDVPHLLNRFLNDVCPVYNENSKLLLKLINIHRDRSIGPLYINNLAHFSIQAINLYDNYKWSELI